MGAVRSEVAVLVSCPLEYSAGQYLSASPPLKQLPPPLSLRVPRVLHLHPDRLPTQPPVRAVFRLGHDALEIQLATLLEQLHALAVDVVEVEHTRGLAGDELAELPDSAH